MRMLAHALGMLLIGSTLAGCGSSGSPTTGSSAAPAGSAAPGGTAAAAAKKDGIEVALPKFGLKAKAAGETEQPIIGDGDPAMVMASQFAVTISEAKADSPKTAKDAEKAAELFNPKNLKSEKLADGWYVTFENTGSAGANYFVNMRRDIGGKSYLCDTTQSSPEQLQKAIEFCKSLTKA